ncbi:hypothetical protein MAPG_11065 [Magnaporthiopsis poae ATCC 64411]|uniref:Uncharacterized protein n=1 Tax=Magnaporthiopsis poae (strain ATCC 64411 / 73-15) TaxID=644358 RepID=A0A0C4EE97_MAGP6|nr:hypothetical protein MAPG_11065 [Magnaporthiopsis poae ATCC 64411]
MHFKAAQLVALVALALPAMAAPLDSSSDLTHPGAEALALPVLKREPASRPKPFPEGSRTRPQPGPRPQPIPSRPKGSKPDRPRTADRPKPQPGPKAPGRGSGRIRRSTEETV